MHGTLFPFHWALRRLLGFCKIRHTHVTAKSSAAKSTDQIQPFKTFLHGTLTCCWEIQVVRLENGHTSRFGRYHSHTEDPCSASYSIRRAVLQWCSLVHPQLNLSIPAAGQIASQKCTSHCAEWIRSPWWVEQSEAEIQSNFWKRKRKTNLIYTFNLTNIPMLFSWRRNVIRLYAITPTKMQRHSKFRVSKQSDWEKSISCLPRSFIFKDLSGCCGWRRRRRSWFCGFSGGVCGLRRRSSCNNFRIVSSDTQFQLGKILQKHIPVLW